MALAVAGNRQRRSRHVGTRSMVDRRPPFWVETHRSCAPQDHFSVSVSSCLGFLSTNSPPQKRLLFACRESAISLHVGLCANGAGWIIAFINGTKRLSIRIQLMRLNKRLQFPVGGVMLEIENFQDSVQHCFEVAMRSYLLEEDVAVEAFELLTTNNHDGILAHALGVSL